MKKVKMILALQMCHKDWMRGLRLARLCAKLQESYCPDTEFWLYFAKKIDREIMPVDKLPTMKRTVDMLSEKFANVRVMVCEREGEGYPHGAAEMWFDLIHQACKKYKSKEIDHDCMLTFEADAVPVTRDWHYRIRKEWYAAFFEKGKLLTGAHSCCTYKGQLTPHINGNMCVAIDLAYRKQYLCGCPTYEPWDLYYANDMLVIGEPSAIMHNDYQKTQRYDKATEKQLFDVRGIEVPAYIHGILDEDCMDIVAKRNELGTDWK